jgi:hypothetical protein
MSSKMPGKHIQIGLSIEGFKSFRSQCRVQLRPLTVLAGPNSSGKSTFFQPFLLLKQTEEEPSTVDPVHLSGPYVNFRNYSELFWHRGREHLQSYSVGLFDAHGDAAEQQVSFDADSSRLVLTSLKLVNGKSTRVLKVGDSFSRNVFQDYDKSYDGLLSSLSGMKSISSLNVGAMTWHVVAHKGYLVGRPELPRDSDGKMAGRSLIAFLPWEPLGLLESCCRNMIHLPGLRNEPARTYPLIYPRFPSLDDSEIPDFIPIDERPTHFSGQFQNHVAGILDLWQQQSRSQQNGGKLGQLNRQLHDLGFRGSIRVRHVSDTDAEILLGNCSLADVGLGVSQVLPILVALLAAVPRQIVHVEQPELHLHPGAQSRLVRILSDAAKRGVLVVVETHSPLILLGVQTLVANGTLAPNMVALNWFSLTSEGSSQVVRRDLDERGRVSDWPEDFGKVTLAAQNEYLLASLKRSGR